MSPYRGRGVKIIGTYGGDDFEREFLDMRRECVWRGFDSPTLQSHPHGAGVFSDRRVDESGGMGRGIAVILDERGKTPWETQRGGSLIRYHRTFIEIDTGWGYIVCGIREFDTKLVGKSFVYQVNTDGKGWIAKFNRIIRFRKNNNHKSLSYNELQSSFLLFWVFSTIYILG